MIVEKKENGFTCHMTEQEFIGIFRTVGATNDFYRRNENSRLTRKESSVTHAAYTVAFHADSQIQEVR